MPPVNDCCARRSRGSAGSLTRIENDYGADYEVEIFEDGLSTGATFKVQLKSSGVYVVLV